MKNIPIFALFLTCLLGSAFGANSVYIANALAGGNTGVDCANAKAASYFNTSGSWHNPPTGIQIGSDTTVYLCGTISTDLTWQGSGTSGHPVILDGTGATMNSRMIMGVSYFTIQNVTWATAYWSDYPAIWIQGSDHGTIQANTIDIANPPGPTEGRPAKIIQIDGGSGSNNLTIQNNFFRNAATGSGEQVDMIDSDGANNVIIQGNYFEERVQDASPCPGVDNCHDDMIQMWGPSGNTPTGYNWTVRYNKFWMNTTTNINRSFTMIQGSAAGYWDIYSNVFVGLLGAHTANGQVCCSPEVAGNVEHLYNNTFIEKAGGPTNLVWVTVSPGSAILKNNIVYVTDSNAWHTPDGTITRGTNLWYNASTGTIPSCVATELCGQNPLFNNVGTNDFSLQSGSPARNLGENLGVTYNQYPLPTATWPNPALGTRPATGAWDTGAYQGAATVAPLAPTNLTVIVH